jgi:hypothetical protein
VTTAVFDKSLELLAPGTALTANGNGTGVLLYPRDFPMADWVVYASGVLGTGTYTFNLQVSDLVGGTYTTIASIVWPPAVAGGKLHVGINGAQAQWFDNDSKFVRVNYVIGATSSIVVGSYITLPSNNAGLAVDVGDIYTFV